MKDYHVLAGIYGLICILMLSVVLFDEFWKGDVLQFVFDSVKYIFAIAVLFVIRMFMREKMFNPMWEKIADPYKDDEEKKRVRICLLYTSPSPRDATLSRMPSSA